MVRPALALLTAALAGCSTTSAGTSPIVVSGHTAVTARSAAPDEPRKPDPAEVRELEKALRSLLLQHMPDPAVTSAKDWGKQEEVVVGVGGRLRRNPAKEVRNHGHWRRISVSAVNPEQTLALGITDAAFPEPGKATLTAMVGLDCKIRFEQQLWRKGRRLYSGETRGHCRAALLLKCEVTSKTETKPGSFLPELVFRTRVTEAQLFYQDLEIDHTAGIGGDGAEILGAAVIDVVKSLKPDLERDLLAKANAAIVKAADTKEVRVSFDALLKGGPVVSK